MHKMPFQNEEFDFIYSSLAIHYSSMPQKVVQEVSRVLSRYGAFLFSTVHPVRWASQLVVVDGVKARVLGCSNNPEQPMLVGTYMTYTEHEHYFADDEILKFWVGPPSMWFNLLQDSKLQVEGFHESQAIDECREKDNYYVVCYQEFRQFMAFLASKQSV